MIHVRHTHTHTFFIAQFTHATFRMVSSYSYLNKSMRRLFLCIVIWKLRLHFGARCCLAFCQFHVIRETKKNGTSLTGDESVRCGTVAPQQRWDDDNWFRCSLRRIVRLSVLEIEIFYSMNFATLSFIYFFKQSGLQSSSSVRRLNLALFDLSHSKVEQTAHRLCYFRRSEQKEKWSNCSKCQLLIRILFISTS